MCGACVEVCPVRIPLVELILKLRERRIREGFSDSRERLGMRLFGAAVKEPALFNWAERSSSLFWPLIRKLSGRDVAGRLPKPATRSFHRRMP